MFKKFLSSGKSSDDEVKLEPISLGDCPVPCQKKSSAVHARWDAAVWVAAVGCCCVGCNQ